MPAFSRPLAPGVRELEDDLPLELSEVWPEELLLLLERGRARRGSTRRGRATSGPTRHGGPQGGAARGSDR